MLVLATFVLTAAPASAHHKEGHQTGNGNEDGNAYGQEKKSDDEESSDTSSSEDDSSESSSKSSSNSSDEESSASSEKGTSKGSESKSSDSDSGGKPAHGCDQANFNDGDPFDSTCDGSAAMNGGKVHKNHCAGCVGAADNKNPGGQALDDHNNGYECDGNNGIGKTNPAHSGCKSAEAPPPEKPEKPEKPEEEEEEVKPKVITPPTREPSPTLPSVKPQLPVTGVETHDFLAISLVLISLGTLLQRMAPERKTH